MNRQRIRAKKTTGFTIVELLVVIVIISILSSITVVAFNGVSKRAQSSAQKALVKNWIQNIDNKIAVGTAFPAAGYSCIGSAATDFPAATGFAAGECWWQQDDGYAATTVSYDAAALGAFALGNGSQGGLHATAVQTDDWASQYRTRGAYIRFFDSSGTKSLRLRWIPIFRGDCSPGRDEFGTGGICSISRTPQ